MFLMSFIKFLLLLYFYKTFVSCKHFLHFHNRRCDFLNGIRLSIDSDTSGERIAGGEDVEIAEVPYHVRFGDCSGVILTSRWILSAAHCIEKSDVIHAGSDTLTGEQIIKVIDTVPHPKFRLLQRKQVRSPAVYNERPDTYPTHDLMLLLLEKDLEYNEHVMNIELGNRRLLKPGLRGSISGWGKKYFLGSVSQRLRIACLPIYDKGKCHRYHQYHGVKIDESMFCALSTDGSIDACPGDSGGPFVVNSKLVGVSSFGRGCGMANTPGVWTDVTAMKDWVYSIIRNSSLTAPGAVHNGLENFNLDD